MYAVRLPGLLVVDIDTDTPEAHAFVEKHFGASTVQVRTPRGKHHYYRLEDGTNVPANIRQDGIAIDFKRGQNSYVAGPLSIRPDGGSYEPLIGVLGETELPLFCSDFNAPNSGNICNTKPSPLSYRSNRGKISTGQRNGFLTRKAVSFVECVDSEAELLDELKSCRNYECEDFETIPDSELIGIANWAWQLRLKNSIFSGRKSGVFVSREIMDILLPLPNGENAFALHCLLETSHGHIPGKKFSIHPEAMKRDGLISFGRNSCVQARDLLLDQGLIKPIGRYVRGHHKQQYQLSRLGGGVAHG